MEKGFRQKELSTIVEGLYCEEWILECFDRDIDIIKEIFREFDNNKYCSNLFDEVERYLSYDDFAHATLLAHKLKGCFSYFKVKSLSDTTQQLEYYSKSNNKQKSAESLKSLREEYQKLIIALSNICNNCSE